MDVSLVTATQFMAKPDRHVAPTSIADLLVRAARDYPHAGVCHLTGPSGADATLVTYPALLAEAQRILGGLHAQGCQSGTSVALLLERAADFIPAFWACVLGGYVPCPLVPIRNDPERWVKHLGHIHNLLEGPLLVTTDDLRTELAGIEAAASLETLRTSRPAGVKIDAGSADAAVFMLTSGSTGSSKAVVLTHDNLLASMRGKAEQLELACDDIALNWIAFDHVAALLEIHMAALYVGALQLHIEPAAILTEPLLFLRLIDRHRVSFTFTPNFLCGHINAALQAMEARGVPYPSLDLSCVRCIVSGGEANVVETGRRFLDLLAPFGLPRNALRPAFGMTETCAGSIYSSQFPDGDAGKEFASVGRPISSLQVRIVDEQGAMVPAGESGELQLRGAMILHRYYNNQEATRAAFTADHWFRTGDLARIEEGELYLVGRSKDSIIVSGVNYFSHELETVLDSLEGIERSFVAAFPTRPKGADTEQLVVAFAPAFVNDEAKLHQLTIAVRNTVILLWGFRPALILPLPKSAFQKTSLGKVQRSILRKRLESGDLAEHLAYIEGVTLRQTGVYVPPQNAAETAVAAIYAELFGLDPATVSATANFFDLGGTSLDIIKLKQKLERHLAIKDLPIVRVLQNPTVRALACQDEGVYDPVVPLQTTGAKTPLFCIHPGTGEILVYVSLANYFSNERPFYALRARGFNQGEQPFATFEEMVREYVAAIRARQPHGPYALAGYSFGAPVAFEVAKVLEAGGERVAFVGSIDGPAFMGNPTNPIGEIENAVIVAFFLSLLDRGQLEQLPKQLHAMTPRPNVCAYVIQHANAERLAELDLDVDKFTHWATLAYSLIVIGQAYQPAGKVGSEITVFYANPLWGDKAEWLEKHLSRWESHTRAGVRYVEVAGEHNTLIGPRHVAGFQAVLRAELNRALDGL